MRTNIWSRFAFLLMVPTVVPAPRKMTLGSGQFVVERGAKISVAHADDRTAAETLADEIEDATGRRPGIVVGRSGAIQLVRHAAPGLGEEGYRITVDARRVVVTAPTAAGVFYGAQTLRQLFADRGFPQVTIEDWPSLRWRGVHDDLSRGPVPTLESMKRTVRTLAEYKLNLYALYLEHVFAYREHPLIAPPGGAITAAEIRELVDYARRYHVTVLPEQQTFGHLHHLLKQERYADLAETPHGHVLSPVREGTYDLVRSLYDELVPLFPGPFVHVGGDETWELGEGQTKAYAARVGIGRVYLEHLQKVAQILAPHKKRLMFWADIAVHHPQLLDILPKDMIAVAWAYDPRPSYEALIAPFRNAGFDVFVAPGANNWNMMWPNLDAALANVRDLVRDGRRLGALGMLNTTWDDDGEALFGMTWPALVFGAACAWQTDCSVEDFQAAYDWAFYRATDHDWSGATAELSHIHALAAPTDEAFFAPLFAPQKAQSAAHELRLAAERALATARSHARPRAHAEMVDLLDFAAARLDLWGMKLEYAREITNFYEDAYQNARDRGRVSHDLGEILGINGRLADLRDATTALRDRYAELWRRENRPYWLSNVLLRWDAMAMSIQQTMDAMKAAQKQWQATGVLPPPEQFGMHP